jgi:hypothetical protein
MTREWTEISSVAKDHRWVVVADIDAHGEVRLAHADVFLPRFDDWYLDAQPKIFTHWRYLEATETTYPDVHALGKQLLDVWEEAFRGTGSSESKLPSEAIQRRERLEAEKQDKADDIKELNAEVNLQAKTPKSETFRTAARCATCA